MIDYPFDGEEILRNSKKIRKKLTNDGSTRIHKKIAVLGGSTTNDIIRMTELFLLDQGIEPVKIFDLLPDNILIRITK